MFYVKYTHKLSFELTTKYRQSPWSMHTIDSLPQVASPSVTLPGGHGQQSSLNPVIKIHLFVNALMFTVFLTKTNQSKTSFSVGLYHNISYMSVHSAPKTWLFL